MSTTLLVLYECTTNLVCCETLHVSLRTIISFFLLLRATYGRIRPLSILYTYWPYPLFFFSQIFWTTS